jgi:hypothetical protein
MTPTTRPAYDSQSEVAALTVGSGIVLTQTFALFPGLLPCLLLLLPRQVAGSKPSCARQRGAGQRLGIPSSRPV